MFSLSHHKLLRSQPPWECGCVHGKLFWRKGHHCSCKWNVLRLLCGHTLYFGFGCPVENQAFVCWKPFLSSTIAAAKSVWAPGGRPLIWKEINFAEMVFFSHSIQNGLSPLFFALMIWIWLSFGMSPNPPVGYRRASPCTFAAVQLKATHLGEWKVRWTL